MVKISIQLTQEQVKTLKSLAKTRKTSVAKLIQESVTLFLSKHSEVKRQRALAGIRKIKKMKFHDIEGKTDLSTNHDQYLDEIYAS